MMASFPLPVIIGSTFATANAAARAGLPVPMTQPVFDAANIRMQRLMRFNPLRAVDPENLSLAHDQFDLGILRQGALLWDAMIRRDDTLSFVVPQLQNAIAAKPWGVFKKKNADSKEAARHAAALEYFYASVTAVDAFDRNIRGDRHLLLKQMGSAYAMRYALHHFVWRPQPGKMIEVEGASPVPALSAEMEFVPLWFFENVSGTLRFLPFGGFGLEGRDLDWEGEWMVTSGEGMMFAAAGCYIFKRLSFQDWTIYNERYSQNKVVVQTNARKDSAEGQHAAELAAQFNGDMAMVFYETQPGGEPPVSLIGPQGTTSVDLFERFLKRQDEKMSIMFRGSAQANAAAEQKDTGITAQIKETEALELAHCKNIASACRTFIDRQVIRFCFGEGVEPLAYFGLPDMDEEDAQQLRENAGFLADRGQLVEADTCAERLGITLTEDPTKALQPLSKAPANDPAADPADDPRQTANSRQLNRLQQLVEEALRTGNSNPYHDQHGEFTFAPDGNGGGYSGCYRDATEEEAEIKKGQTAMTEVLDKRADRLDAMYRPGVGNIDFRWGNEGGGIRHIVGKRDREGLERESLAGQKGADVAMRVPEVIARGRLGPPYADHNGRKRNIEHDGMKVILSLDFKQDGQKQRRAWVLSGFIRS